LLANGFIPGSIPVSHSGFIGGGQIGYNWQIDPSWVWGVEADFQGTTVNGSAGSVSLIGANTITTLYKYELDDLGTVRARFGWLSSPNLLWYDTAGLAYGQTKFSTAAQCATCGPPFQSENTTSLASTHTSVGWTAGAGVEWKLTPVWSVKAEYLYAELGSQSVHLRTQHEQPDEHCAARARQHRALRRQLQALLIVGAATFDFRAKAPGHRGLCRCTLASGDGPAKVGAPVGGKAFDFSRQRGRWNNLGRIDRDWW
jgi:opacity protein-like surface antigen